VVFENPVAPAVVVILAVLAALVAAVVAVVAAEAVAVAVAAAVVAVVAAVGVMTTSLPLVFWVRVFCGCSALTGARRKMKRSSAKPRRRPTRRFCGFEKSLCMCSGVGESVRERIARLFIRSAMSQLTVLFLEPFKPYFAIPALVSLSLFSLSLSLFSLSQTPKKKRNRNATEGRELRESVSDLIVFEI